MRKSPLILSSLLVAALAATWWACDQGPATLESAPEGGVGESAGHDETGPSAEIDVDEAATKPSGTTDVEDASLETGDDNGERRSSLDDAFVKVRVLRNGKPVVGAEVRYLDYTRYNTLRQKHKGLSLHYAEWTERFGLKTKTQAGGYAGLPEFQSRMYIVAMHGKDFAYRYVRNNSFNTRIIRSGILTNGIISYTQSLKSGSVRPGNGKTAQAKATKDAKRKQMKVDLSLVPDRHVAIDVLDHRGQPSKNVKVYVYQYWPKKKRTRLILQPTTNGDGRARIRHFQLRDSDKSASWLATPLVLCENQPYALFDHGVSNARLEADGTDHNVTPLVLRLPPMGRIAVRILGPRKTPMRSAARVTLYAKKRIQIGKVKFSTLSISKSRSAGTEDVVFDRVGINHRVRVEARVDRLRARKDVDTPKGHGAERLVKLTFIGRSTVLRGKLLSTASRLRATLISQGRSKYSQTLKLGQDGAFEIAFEQRTAVADYDLILGDSSNASLRASYKITALRQGDERDLGELKLGVAGLAVGGKVIDDLDKPVKNARIYLQRMRSDGKRWDSLPQLVGRTSEDGAFALSYAPVNGRLRLYVSCSGHLAKYQNVQFGQRETVVKLERSASLQVTARTPKWSRDYIELVIKRGKYKHRMRSRARSGKVSWSSSTLKRGTYQFEVYLHRSMSPLVVRGGVTLAPGKNRLTDLFDLANQLHRFTVEVALRGSKKKRSKLSAKLVLFGQGRKRAIDRSIKGTHTFTWPATTVLGQIASSTGRARDVTLTAGRNRIILEDGIKLRLTVPGIKKAVDKRQAWLMLTYTGGNSALAGSFRSRWAQLSKDVIDVKLPAPGPYKVTVHAWQRYNNRFSRWGWGRVVQVPIGSVNVKEGGTTATLSSKGVAEKIAAAEKKPK